MYKFGQTIIHPVDFDNAMLFELNVIVLQDGQIIDFGGKIEKNSEESVLINAEYYLKSDCKFKIR